MTANGRTLRPSPSSSQVQSSVARCFQYDVAGPARSRSSSSRLEPSGSAAGRCEVRGELHGRTGPGQYDVDPRLMQHRSDRYRPLLQFVDREPAICPRFHDDHPSAGRVCLGEYRPADRSSKFHIACTLVNNGRPSTVTFSAARIASA